MTSDFNIDAVPHMDGPEEEIISLRSERFRFYRKRRYGVLHFIKKISPEYEGDLITENSLAKEFQLGYGLTHPSIVRYLMLEGNALYEEYIDGLTLRELIERKDKRLHDNKFLVKICLQLLEGLGFLHSNGIVYLDLKPENVMVTRVGENVKIIDLGGAACSAHDITPGFTSGYESPEQKGGTPDLRTDIHHVGLIMKELTGGARCASKWRKFIKKATAVHPDARYGNCEEAILAIPKQRSVTSAFSVLGVMTAALLMIAIYYYISHLSEESAPMTKTEAKIDLTKEQMGPEPLKSNEKKETLEIAEDQMETHQPDGMALSQKEGSRKPSAANSGMSLQRQVEKKVTEIFEREVADVVNRWEKNDRGMIPSERVSEYYKLTYRAFEKAQAYGEELGSKHPEQQMTINNTVRITSESILSSFQNRFLGY